MQTPYLTQFVLCLILCLVGDPLPLVSLAAPVSASDTLLLLLSRLALKAGSFLVQVAVEMSPSFTTQPEMAAPLQPERLHHTLFYFPPKCFLLICSYSYYLCLHLHAGFMEPGPYLSSTLCPLTNPHGLSVQWKNEWIHVHPLRHSFHRYLISVAWMNPPWKNPLHRI